MCGTVATREQALEPRGATAEQLPRGAPCRPCSRRSRRAARATSPVVLVRDVCRADYGCG